MNFVLVSCETLPVLSRNKTNLSFIQINRRHLEEIGGRDPGPPKQGADSSTVDEGEGGDSNVVTSVMSELNERKQRELNLVIYGVKESDSEIREDRIYYDKQKVMEIGAKCDVILQTEDIGKTVRLGTFDKDRRKRPILVSLKSLESKRNILRGARNLRDEDSNSELRAQSCSHSE